jgi:hypothetical protein
MPGEASTKANPAMQDMAKLGVRDGDIQLLSVENAIAVSDKLTFDRRNSTDERRNAPEPCVQSGRSPHVSL